MKRSAEATKATNIDPALKEDILRVAEAAVSGPNGRAFFGRDMQYPSGSIEAVTTIALTSNSSFRDMPRVNVRFEIPHDKFTLKPLGEPRLLIFEGSTEPTETIVGPKVLELLGEMSKRVANAQKSEIKSVSLDDADMPAGKR